MLPISTGVNASLSSVMSMDAVPPRSRNAVGLSWLPEMMTAGCSVRTAHR